MNNLLKKIFYFSIIFVSLFSIVLNPYFISVRPGLIAVIFLSAYSMLHGFSSGLFKTLIGNSILLACLAAVGLVSSILHGITQFNHVAVVLSLLFLIIASHGLWLICQRCGITVDRLIFLLFIVVLINSCIIILELNFDSLREFIEGYLDPLVLDSINYAEGFRYRGVASSGGANLSLLIPVAVTIGIYLFKKNNIGILFLIVSLTLLTFSVTVIGRTGLILAPFPVVFFIISSLKQNNIKKFIYIGVLISLMGFLLQYFYFFGREFLSEKFGEQFLFYSFEFLFDGKSGVDQEGTTKVIGGFLQVLPSDWTEILFGYGFYGGSHFEPWTDSGFNRMFLSVGYFFGLIFYFIIFRMYFSIANFDKFLILSLISILTFGEIKEALLFTGFSSRVFVILLVFITLDRIRDESASRYYRTRQWRS